MNLRELATQINDMSPAQQEQVALIQDDNTGEFVELLGFVIDEEAPLYLRQANIAYG